MPAPSLVLLLPLSYLSQPDDQAIARAASWPNCAKTTISARPTWARSIRPAKPSSWPRWACAASPPTSCGRRPTSTRRRKTGPAFSATLEQITRLAAQLHRVWRFQGWNLSYNISVEFDDYHDRYYWVIKGINFIIGGTKVQRTTSRDCCTTSAGTSRRKSAAPTNTSNFAKLFKDDDDFFDGTNPTSAMWPADRDNWLVGRDWFLKAQDVVDSWACRSRAPLRWCSIHIRRWRSSTMPRRSKTKARMAKWPRMPGARRDSLARVRRPGHSHDPQPDHPSE